MHATAFPQPLRVYLGFQCAPRLAGDVREERLGQPLAGLAVGAGLGRARALAAGDAVGDQAGDGGAAGVVGAEDLSEEDPQRDQRGKDPVQPTADGGQGLGNDLLGEDIGERQVAVLKELPSEETHLFAKRSGIRIRHPGGLLVGDGRVANSIFTRKALFCLCHLPSRACRDLRTILLTVRRRFWAGGQPVLLASSDRPAVRWIVGLHPAPGEQDVLTAYVMGAAARALASLSPEGRAAWARAEAARVFPEWGGVAAAEAWSHCWDRDPFAGGGYPWPAPGDDFLPETLAAPEGRVHFAGEQTTHAYGWIQGAMQSGLRAACEVHHAVP